MAYVLFCYDVSKDTRRRRLFKRLEALLTRVQYSVFEGRVPDDQREGLLKLATAHIDPDTDQVRVVTLCKSCRENIRLVGKSTRVPDPSEPIVV